MRSSYAPQLQFNFCPQPTKETQKFHSKYEAISEMLDSNPKILRVISSDLVNPLKYAPALSTRDREAEFTADQVLRILVVMSIESLSLRETSVRIDDSYYLRQFTRLFDSKMMDFTTLNKLRNSISSKSWERVNFLLAQFAAEGNFITGKRLRLDTTAVETNIHYPTDSSLLWDCYRVLGGLIKNTKELFPELVGQRRIQTRKAKRLYAKIARISGHKRNREKFVSLYSDLIHKVETLMDISCEVGNRISLSLKKSSISTRTEFGLQKTQESIKHYVGLSKKVVFQATQRVLLGQSVSAKEKVYSIFEEHTELLKRGKAGKPIEYGHMVELEQVEQKFITNYKVFMERPAEPKLLSKAIQHHKRIFGSHPKVLTADKGYFSSGEVEQIRKIVDLVAIAKKGSRTELEREREHRDDFKQAQKFRAGIEGSISFMKRKLGLWRCFNKGWENFCSTVGMTVFAHNLIKLAVP